MDAYQEQDGDLIATANLDTCGHSEKIIVDYSAGRPGTRDRVALTTKSSSDMHG